MFQQVMGHNVPPIPRGINVVIASYPNDKNIDMNAEL